jgi:lauroyl/myristoyl acyltransferase
MDRLWHLHFQQAVQWEPHGQGHLQALSEESGGALVFTIHSGNYDIGTSAFAEHLGRELHIVRVPERDESMQKLRAGELGRINPHLHVHYNLNDARLGLLLCNLLRDGKVVAVQGDRVVREVSSLSVMLDGVKFCLPRGPFVLAEMNRVPCYPIFLRRVGRLRYAIEIYPSLTARGVSVTGEELGERWLAVLKPFLQRHWDQWFVFESVVTRAL